MIDVIAALDALIQRRDIEGVFSLLVRVLERKKAKGTQTTTQLEFAFLNQSQPSQSDDRTFVEAMNNFPQKMAEALRRKREREAEAEEKRAELARKARETQTLEDAIAVVVARGKTPGQILKLAQRIGEVTIDGIESALRVPRNRIHVALHTLETKRFLSRVRPGVYVPRSSEGATSERCGNERTAEEPAARTVRTGDRLG